MSLSFGKLMQAADKNSQVVSKKISQIDAKNNQSNLRGPDPNAVRAFLEKKKTDEQRRLEAKRHEDAKRLEENRAKEAKLKRTGSKMEFYKQMLQKSPSKKQAPGDYEEDKTPQRLKEELKNDIALNKARLKLSKHNSIDERKDKKSVPISNSVVLDRRKEESRDKRDNLKKPPTKSAAALPIKPSQPVDFVKLMQVAVKNREEKIHLDDNVDALKKKAEENLRALNLKPKPALVIKPKHDKILDAPSKTKSISTSAKSTNEHKLKSKSSINNLPASSLPKSSTVINKLTPKLSTTKNGAVKTTPKDKIAKNVVASASTNAKKPLPATAKPKTGVVKNESAPKSALNKPLPSKLDNLKPKIAATNYSKPVKRPGTPPKTTPVVVKKPKLPPPAILRNLPSTSGQTFAKKADLERALARRREMLFKNPRGFQRELENYAADSDEEGDDDDEEYDSEMDDFIDDTEYDDDAKYRQEIRQMFKYNPKKYKHLDVMDDRLMESSYRDIQKEEARSARLGLIEDLEDIQREQEEMKKKMKSSR